MAKQKYYAVKVGLTPGVYLTWDECKAQVDGFPGAVHKSFPTMEEAAAYAGVENVGQESARQENAGAENVGAEKHSAQDDNNSEETGTELKSSVPNYQTGNPAEKDGMDVERTTYVEYKIPQKPDLPPLEEGTAVAYVDGSYNVATKEYSCGVVFMVGTEEIHIARRGESKELASMRNVAGEILGAELAMRKAMELRLKKISIYHDYEGIAAWCLGRWKTNREGTKAYKEYFDSIKDRMVIEFVKVKGHSGDKYNDKADELAKGMIFPQI